MRRRKQSVRIDIFKSFILNTLMYIYINVLRVNQVKYDEKSLRVLRVKIWNTHGIAYYVNAIIPSRHLPAQS